jgi:hypothetical protein
MCAVDHETDSESRLLQTFEEKWDFVIQQQLPQDWLVQIGYTGGKDIISLIATRLT